MMRYFGFDFSGLTMTLVLIPTIRPRTNGKEAATATRRRKKAMNRDHGLRLDKIR